MAKNNTGWSERVRDLARREYVEPARGASTVVRIPFGEFKAKLVKSGFPASNANQVATPLESERLFLAPLGLELVSPKGQPRTVDSTLEFRFIGEPAVDRGPEVQAERTRRALEAADKLRGLLKDEIAAFGGAEAFIRWVRSEEDEDAA
jgi:hypothetical protein